MTTDLYRVDNVLLKTGVAAAAILIFVALAWKPWESRQPDYMKTGDYLVTELDGRGRIVDTRVHVHPDIATEEERIANIEGRYPNALHIRRSPPPAFSIDLSRAEIYFLLAGLGPIALIGFGWVVRRKEKRILSLWKHLRNNVETHVPALLANSDFTRDELKTTVRLLNNRGLAFYRWDRATDTIEDGRLASAYVHIDKCESCGASVGIRIRASLSELPLCPYCNGGLSATGINTLKQQALNDLRGGNATGVSDVPAPAQRKPMSMGLFIVLVLFCWPAAVAYAIYKNQSPRRLA